MGLTELLWMLAAGGGTTLGALLIVVWRDPSDRLFDLSLGAGAGIMLAATVLGLIPAALEDGSFMPFLIGFSFGVAVIAWGDNIIPHVHARFSEKNKATISEDHERFVTENEAGTGGEEERIRRGLLLTSAIALHNFPEGMAVGVAFATGSSELGVALALAILVHNIPEGLAVALPLRSMRFSLPRTIWWTAVTGLIEIAGAFIGYLLGRHVEVLLPYGLGFAAGAMLYVVVDEMVPAAHTRGEQRASVIFLVSFAAMAAVMHYIGALVAS